MLKSDDCDVDYIKIKAPATAANLGAGFDVFGMALEIPYDVIELETNDSLEIVIKGKNAGDIPIPTEPLKNTAGFVASELGCNVKITIHKGIVPGSGLGSSAAPAAGTAFGLNKMFELGFSLDELVWLAAKGEVISAGVEHADNAAAAIFGGFTVVHGNQVIALSPVNIGIVAILPDLIVNTRDARRILPKSLSLEDFVFNVGSASMMVVGMLRNDLKLIGESMQNHVIEPARARLIPGYLDVRNSALQAGATGVTISGSGPAMIAVCALDKREEVASAMVDAFAKNGIDSEVFITTVGRGVEILE
jgi:homoserine kinase